MMMNYVGWILDRENSQYYLGRVMIIQWIWMVDYYQYQSGRSARLGVGKRHVGRIANALFL